MNLREFQENRARFSHEELLKYDGKWVAFSLDGRRIVASDEDLALLYDQIRTAGEDPQNTALERIEFSDLSYGGAEAH